MATMTNLNYSGGQTVYIQQNNTDIQYSTNGNDWMTIFWPVFVENNDNTQGLLKIEFTTDLNLSNDYNYFICGTSHIQFGSTTIKNDASSSPLTNINIGTDASFSYNGFIQNGTTDDNGRNYIYIFNIYINANGTQLNDTCGWVGSSYFGKNAINNYIVNCHSNGIIGTNSGGITGGYSNGITFIGCSSSGSSYGGGIVGNYSSNIKCISCWSTGSISNNGGGIAGSYLYGECEITNCYSNGTISENCGGIVGANCGNDLDISSNVILIQNCYSTGNIGLKSGGIIGPDALPSVFTILNCYSTGDIANAASIGERSGGGIIGYYMSPTPSIPNYNVSHCYCSGSCNNFGYIISNTNAVPANCYSEAELTMGGWNSTNAKSVLIMTNDSPIWLEIINNNPFELFNMGYTPYSLNNINFAYPNEPSLNRQYALTVNEQTYDTINAYLSSNSFTLFDVSYNSITIDQNTGVISIDQLTNGTYILYINNLTIIYSVGETIVSNYANTTVILNIVLSNGLSCLVDNTYIYTPNGYININKLQKGNYVITSNNKKTIIIDIIKTLLIGNSTNYPYIIPKDGISLNYPKKELYISGNHMIQYNGWICPKFYFTQDTSYELITYYHIKLPNYLTDHLIISSDPTSTLLSDGIIVESLGNYNLNNYNILYHNEYTNRMNSNKKKLQLINSRI